MSTKILLSENIRKYRRQLGLTQQALAVKAGLPLSILAKIEQKFSIQPTIQTVIKIADALNISIDELVGRQHKPTL